MPSKAQTLMLPTFRRLFKAICVRLFVWHSPHCVSFTISVFTCHKPCTFEGWHLVFMVKFFFLRLCSPFCGGSSAPVFLFVCLLVCVILLLLFCLVFRLLRVWLFSFPCYLDSLIPSSLSVGCILVLHRPLRGNLGRLTLVIKAQQPQEQRYPFLSVCAAFSCVQTMVWLPVLGIFNMRRCWCMWLHMVAVQTL